MAYLTSQQRNSLEKAVVAARKAAELGARNALISLAVDQPHPFPSLTSAQMNLREQLRNKARLLGDVLEDGYQPIDRLVNELAYEYWHKMLFARFLEANNLLMHPDGVPVSMEDCEELAPEMGLEDKWEVASTFASKMLPAIFRPSDPVLQVRFAANDRIKLESILDDLEAEIFSADDSLGWVYQFWQSEAKAVINASGEKIDGEKLPAVTQLFTEPYMVHFLIDNTIGAWWVSRHKGVTPPVDFEYLRMLDDGSPAAGSYPDWPDSSAEITFMDLCMGSGHIVVAVFLVLVRLRVYEENISADVAVKRVISENIHGLELDPRCTQIAAFNLALAAWKICGGYRELHEMNLACSGIAPAGKKEEWIKLVEAIEPADFRTRLENGMALLYDHFQLAPELGSLLDPGFIRHDVFIASYEELQPILFTALQNEKYDNDYGVNERGVMAFGIASVGALLGKKYVLQITNVPYLSRGKQGLVMADHFLKYYSKARGDLATVFLDKMLKVSKNGGTVCSVMPQNSLYLSTYKDLRAYLLTKNTWVFVVRLGARSFRTPMYDFNVMLLCITNSPNRPEDTFVGLDISELNSASQKAEALLTTKAVSINQAEQLFNPDARVVLSLKREVKLLSEYADDSSGCLTGDGNRFYRYIWEIQKDRDWEYLQSTTSSTTYYDGCSQVIFWQSGRGELYELAERMKHQNNAVQNWRRGQELWGRDGVAVSSMGSLPVAIYSKGRFDNNTAVLVPKEPDYLSAIWCFCSSPKFHSEVRKIDQSLKVTNSTLVKIPFDLEYWKDIAFKLYPNGLPEPYSDDPTQWQFHGHPTLAHNSLHVSIARFIGYRFSAETDKEMELSNEARKLMEAIKKYDHFSDNDGVVCIPSVNGELPASDRIREYVKEVSEERWNHNTVSKLLHQEGSNKPSMDEWLRDEFFDGHCQLFQNRPFVWHIWDGRKDGFSVLVNYHKFNKEALQKLIYGYLGDWIRQCEAKKKSGESGAEGLLTAAMKLKEKLEAILVGEPPFDIFVRWKPLHEQPIGWEPDLNDGVRINIRPFIEAGILRKKVKIKYGIDRGKNPPGAPWGEIRDNDLHLTLEEKRKAREKRKQK